MTGPLRAWLRVALALGARSVERFYDLIAPVYDEVFGRDQREHAAAIVRLVQQTAGLRRGAALDLGAGTGILTSALGCVADTIVGLDRSRPMLERGAAAAGGPRWVRADFLELPFSAASFDVVAGLGMASHVPAADVDGFAAEVVRTVRHPGLVVIGMTPFPWRLAVRRRNPLRVTIWDRLLVGPYNLLQALLRFDERRWTHGPERFREAFVRLGLETEFREVGPLAVLLARAG
jgi:SAM-dependent methyltransferase